MDKVGERCERATENGKFIVSEEIFWLWVGWSVSEFTNKVQFNILSLNSSSCETLGNIKEKWG